jgi:MSHA biogenesis protein MshN
MAAPKPPATKIAIATGKPAPAAGGKAEIEKQVRQPTQRDLADNEYRKAASSLHQGRLAEAQEGFRAALNLYPAHHGARQALVALLVESKAFAEAERALQEGIRLAPEQIGFAMTLGRLQVNRNDNAGAIATLQSVVGHAQSSADYVAFLAALLQRQARHEDAIEQFQAALRLKPGAGVWWLGLAMSLQAVNRVPEAQEAYRRAKSTNNLNPELAAFADQRLRQLQ